MPKDNQILIAEQPRSHEKAKNGSPTGAPPAQPQKSSARQWLIIGVLCIVAVAGIYLWGAQKRRAASAAAAAASRARQAPVPVVAGTVTQKNVPIYLDGLGTVQAFYTVTVRSRVDGELKKVGFVEGQDVHKGDLLAQIDPAPYQTALDQAKAKKGQDEAQLANAELDLKREANLYAAKIDSQQVYDTQKALVNQLAAAVKADEAAIGSAQVNLNYTTITSPIDGRTGIRQIDPGNIVHAADSNGLVVVTELMPISVMFTLPEQMLNEIHKQMAAAGELTVMAMDRDNSTLLDKGALSVIDNQIDTTTGTIKLKATFPNESLMLWPGQFVNARLLLTTRTNGIVVPAVAVQRGPEGAYVFVIVKGARGGKGGAETKVGQRKTPNTGDGTKPDNQEVLTVEVRPVKVAQIEAGEALIDSGLEPGEQVVTDGQYKLQAGSKVKLTSAKAMNADGSSSSSGKGSIE
ncbi:MAG TPA: efflux RND transporter periplasmic adaptor subunit [Verrucomicrobiae bacterium]|nr:efflux RND transporter periplasmic adaptor subunit [Verrucomicrobiae bacterium]